MRTLTLPTVSVVVLALVWNSAACQRGPSVPRVKQPGPPGSVAAFWPPATIVAIGTVRSPHRVGTPQLATYGNTSARVYPCEAQFHAAVLIKSEAGIDNRRLLWFSGFPTCSFGLKPEWEIRSAEQVWFLRTEGTWLRPVTDIGGTFLELYQHFEATGDDSETLRRTLSRYLLNPAAIAETEERFIQRFNELFRLSCEIAGEQWSLQVLGDLQRGASPEVREKICRFLAGADQCRHSDCPPGPLPPGIDPAAWSAQRDRDQEAHKKSDLHETSEERVKVYLKSGQPKEWEQRTLEGMSCNFDPVIRRRAGKLLRKYFPESHPAPCISCR
jgi:hypothetical protein